MNLKLFAVSQITSNQTAHFGNQTLRPRVRGKELSLEVFRRQLRVGVAYVPGEFGGQPCDRSSVRGRCSSNHAFRACRHENLRSLLPRECLLTPDPSDLAGLRQSQAPLFCVGSAQKTLKAIPPSLTKFVHQTAARTSCRCALQRRDEWAAKLPPVAVTSSDKQRQQFFNLTQLRHPLTHNCQLLAGDLLHLAAMPAVL